ncbi:MAG: YraN family protein [Coriobacteriales bacterium]|nr:YraN family protein [Coriobacteriales bacterium]MBQ6585723.1 YraN family protein [Coriobacteriales bacterium]
MDGERMGFESGSRKSELGRRGEEIAYEWLCTHTELEVIERNWRCRLGEADIIAWDKGVLVFVEVKTRADLSRGLPEEAVTSAKRRRYEKIACCYLADHRFDDCRVRFDVIGILLLETCQPIIHYYPDAFGAGD